MAARPAVPAGQSRLGRALIDAPEDAAEVRPANHAALHRRGGLAGATELAEERPGFGQVDALADQRRPPAERVPDLGGVAVLDPAAEQSDLERGNRPRAFVH